MVLFILILHLSVILFFILGFPIGLMLNHRGFRYFHSAALALITLLMVAGIPCPLTIMEESFRGSSYEGSFIAFWLNQIIYLEWFQPLHVLIMDLCFAALVFSSFFWHPVQKDMKK